MYIVELEKGVWLAPWSGDPGRTLKMCNAKEFKTRRQTCLAIGRALKYRNFKDPKVERRKK